MTITRRCEWVATAAIVLAAVASCADSGADPSPQTPTPSPSSAITTTSQPTDSEAAAAVASELVRRYFAMIDDLRQDPELPASQLTEVTVSSQLAAQETLLRSQRKDRLHQVGDTKVLELNVQSVNLDNSDPNSGKVPTVVVDVCWDVSQVDVIDKNGKSVVRPSRPAMGWTRLTVANYHWASDPTGAWRIASGQDLEKAPCTAS